MQEVSGRVPDLALALVLADVAEGELDPCIRFCGDIWDHASPSVIVEQAGGRFGDHAGGKRLDNRIAIYFNG